MFCSLSNHFPCPDNLQQLHPHADLQTLVKPAGGARLAVLGHLEHDANITYNNVYKLIVVLCSVPTSQSRLPLLQVMVSPAAMRSTVRRKKVRQE